MDFSRLQKLAEGKTKIIYANPEDPRTVFMLFKDDITAGDGVRHDVIEGKALLDWRVNRDVFAYLNRRGIPTHYLGSPEERVALVRRLDRKINLEVVSRRVAAGSIVHWGGIPEGRRFDPAVTQFHYKDDPLHDPMLNEDYLDYLIREKHAGEYARMREINAAVLACLEAAFATFGVQLVDLKLEYGMVAGAVTVIDEISAGSLRLWPYRRSNPDLRRENILAELDPEGRLDKDTYRMGQTLDAVKARFAAVADLTARFESIP